MFRLHPSRAKARLRILSIGLVFGLWASASVSARVEPGRRLKIITTIFPLMEFARETAGERGDVSLVLPPGTEIHTWQPRPRDIVALSQADLFVYVGSHLEPWAEDLLGSRAASRLKVLEASRELGLWPGQQAQSERDPHFWLDLSLDAALVERLSAVLSELCPSGAALFQENAASYIQKLRDLDQRFRTGLEGCPQRTLVVAGHAAFGYLAARYGLQQIALYGLSPDSEPTPRKLLDVTSLLKERGIMAVFFESSVNPKLGRIMAREAGAETLVLSDAVVLSRDELRSRTTFLEIMSRNLESLKHGLRCR